jgi:hypothetical protein
VFVAFCIFEKTAKACASEEISSWEVKFENGTIFYMTSPSWGWGITEERAQIRTGLYYDTEPLENIYFANINAHKGSVFFSECGKYFATVQRLYNNFDSETLGGGLVNFFENGVLTKSYDTNKIPIRTPPGWRDEPWHSYGAIEAGLNALNENTLTISTITNHTFDFDITTGEITFQSGGIFNWSTILILSAGLILIANAIIITIGVRKKSAKNKGL